MHIHTEECRWTVKGDGKRRCLTARLERERAARAAGTRDRLGKKIQRPVDGLEEEYGPCPMPVPVSRWYDQVAVDRAFRGERVGRELTPPESSELQRRQLAANRQAECGNSIIAVKTSTRGTVAFGRRLVGAR